MGIETAISFKSGSQRFSRRIWTANQSAWSKSRKDETRAMAVESPGALFVLKSCPGCHEAGDRSLDPSYSQSKAQRMDGKDQLVNSHPLCTNHLREEYSIKEANDFCYETGKCKDESPFDEKMFLAHKNSLNLFHNIFRKET